MDLAKTLSPITKTLKNQKTPINFVLIFVVLLMIFPYSHFLPFEIKNKLVFSYFSHCIRHGVCSSL